MMDCGSTGSRVHVYRWVWEGGALPNVTDDFFYEIKPGVSSFKDEPLKAGASLQPLLDYALNKMPAARVKDSWVRLYATAGLRLLPTETQEALLSAIRAQLKASPFLFESDDHVAISDGIDEAVDAWVTANYILGGATASSELDTVGTLDLGGASVQVTTRTAGPIPDKHKYVLALADNEIPLYAHSHLAYGLKEARKRVDMMVQGRPDKRHPCLLEGSSVDLGGTTYKGSSDFEGCVDLHRKISDYCHYKIEECSPLSSIPPPKHDGVFLAFSYFWDVLTEFMADNRTPTVAQIRARAQQVCSVNADALAVDHASSYEPGNPEFLTRACQDMTYILHLLSEHLGFEDNAERIRLVKQIEGKEMSWTLGASLRMLHGPPKAKGEL